MRLNSFGGLMRFSGSFPMERELDKAQISYRHFAPLGL